MTALVLSKNHTKELLLWAKTLHKREDDPFKKAQQIARRLGAHYQDGLTTVGFWLPHTGKNRVSLETFTPITSIDWKKPEQEVPFHREIFPLSSDGNQCYWGVIQSLQPGTFYQFRWKDQEGQSQTGIDPLAYSVPFGLAAPSELYDIEKALSQRTDRAYFHEQLATTPDPDGTLRVLPASNILELHVGTATAEGTFASLTRLYKKLAEKCLAKAPLESWEKHFLGYEAIELLPIEPILERDAGPPLWEIASKKKNNPIIRLRQSSTFNWGYDVPIAGASAIHPFLLESKRPDEFISFISTLHNFPRPIKVILDLVYGHAESRANRLLPPAFFSDVVNPYGLHLDYQNPWVRAILLESQRRKSNFGSDGLRIDASDNIQYKNPATGEMECDEEYLYEMSQVTLEVAERRFRPWMIFEDGRPYPQEPWKVLLLDKVTKKQPYAFQWSPLTISRSNPFCHGFWKKCQARIGKFLYSGDHSITGFATHDTLRRATQVDPQLTKINPHLGSHLPEILQNSYNNSAARLIESILVPGIPIHFIQASFRAPWGFFRNQITDTEPAKFLAEEAKFLDWTIEEQQFAEPWAFPALKKMGFETYGHLREFLQFKIIHPEGFLTRVLENWMADVYQMCNLGPYQKENPNLAAEATFALQVREFRLSRPWLRHHYQEKDHYGAIFSDTSVIHGGLRQDPEGREALAFVLNVEGRAKTIQKPTGFLPISAEGWKPVLVPPTLRKQNLQIDRPIFLQNGEGVVFQKILEG